MIKQITFILLILINVSYGQQKNKIKNKTVKNVIANNQVIKDTQFSFTKEGFTDFIITNCPKKSKRELYKKTLNWLAVTFVDPEKVIKGKVEDEFISFEWFDDKNVRFEKDDPFFIDVKCRVEISFKDGRYKFDIVSLKYGMNGDWAGFDINNVGGYYDGNGEIKKTYNYFPSDIPMLLNNLNDELKKFIESKEIPSKNDKW